MQGYFFLPVAWLLSSPLVGRAQAPPPAPLVPRAYVGLALYTSEFHPLSFSQNGYYQERQLPVQLTAAYHLRPRWAVQASVAYSYRRQEYSGVSADYDYPTPMGQFPIYYYYSYSSRRNVSVALLGHYTLTRQLAHRFRADVLAGLTVVKQQFERGYARTDYDSLNNAHSQPLQLARSRPTALMATAGVGLRYRLAPRLEATFDGTANVDFYHNMSGLNSSLALGLRAGIGRQR